MEFHLEDTVVRELSAEAILPLRTRVLRPHFEPGLQAHFLEDDLPITRHYAVLDRPCPEEEERILAVATFFKHDSPVFEGEPAIKLRGMAVDPQMQGHGLGTMLLEAAMPRLALAFPECPTIWCNARLSAVPFYRRAGFKTWGDEFMIPDIGLHLVMWRAMPIALAEQFV